MPHSDLHKKKLKKNLMLLGLLLAWCAVIWGVSMVRIANGAEPQLDTERAFIKQRATHMNRTQIREDAWHQLYERFEPERQRTQEIRTHNRDVHMQYNIKIEEIWNKKYEVMAPLRRIFAMTAENRRKAYLSKFDGTTEQEWWDNWLAGESNMKKPGTSPPAQ